MPPPPVQKLKKSPGRIGLTGSKTLLNYERAHIRCKVSEFHLSGLQIKLAYRFKLGIKRCNIQYFMEHFSRSLESSRGRSLFLISFITKSISTLSSFLVPVVPAQESFIGLTSNSSWFRVSCTFQVAEIISL